MALRLLHPEDRGSLEDITLHLQLGAPAPQPDQLLAIISGQALGLVALDPVTLTSCPVAQRPLVDPQLLAISAMGLPVSRTILTAPPRNSGSNFLLVSGIVTPHRRCLHGEGGRPTIDPHALSLAENIWRHGAIGDDCVPEL